jgi:hypothetical protein
LLLAIQTLAVAFLLWIVFPIFHDVMTNIGERREISTSRLLGVFSGTFVLQASYWGRVLRVSVQPPCHNIFLAHLVAFAARLSFLFGGAFFATIFFRHLPEIAALPAFGELVVNALAFAITLFGLFCYSLELERLGRAIEGPRSL